MNGSYVPGMKATEGCSGRCGGGCEHRHRAVEVVERGGHEEEAHAVAGPVGDEGAELLGGQCEEGAQPPVVSLLSGETLKHHRDLRKPLDCRGGTRLGERPEEHTGQTPQHLALQALLLK